MTRRASLGAGVGLILAIASRTAAAESVVLNLKLWAANKEVTDAIIADFHRVNPGIKVEWTSVTKDQYYGPLREDLAAGKGPDVFAVDSGSNLRGLDATGGLMDLAGRFAREKGPAPADFLPQPIAWFTRGSRLLAIPNSVDTGCIYYNRSLFKAAGLPMPHDDWTADEFRRAAIRLTKRDAAGRVVRWGYFPQWARLSDDWAGASGGGVADQELPPTRITGTSAESLHGLTFAWNLLHRDRAMRSPNIPYAWQTDDDSMFMFRSGRTAMVHWGGALWFLRDMRSTIKDFEWDLVPLPRFPPAKRRMVGEASGYAINNRTARAAESWKLVRYLTSSAVLARMAKEGLAFPPLPGVVKAWAAGDKAPPANKAAIVRMVEESTSLAVWPEWSSLGDNWWQRTQRIWDADFKGSESDMLAVLREAAVFLNLRMFSDRYRITRGGGVQAVGEGEAYQVMSAMDRLAVVPGDLAAFAKEFVANHPASPHVPEAMYLRARAEIVDAPGYAGASPENQSRMEAAMREIVDKFPAMPASRFAWGWLAEAADRRGDTAGKAAAWAALKRLTKEAPAFLRDRSALFYGMDMTGRLVRAFSVKGTRDEELSPARYRGRAVLLVFWSVEHGSAADQVVSLKPVYERHRKNGFEIVGISCDRSSHVSREDLAAWLDREGIAWPQYYDGLGWKNKLFVLYKIPAVPTTILVGRDGKIAAVNLRGEALEKAVARLVKGSKGG